MAVHEGVVGFLLVARGGDFIGGIGFGQPTKCRHHVVGGNADLGIEHRVGGFGDLREFAPSLWRNGNISDKK